MSIRQPFGATDNQSPSYGATITCTINNDKTIITPATLTGNVTINLSINSEIGAGAEIILISTADGMQRTITLGTGFNTSTPNLVIPATTTMTANYIYSGTEFVEKSEPTGIDAVAMAANTAHRTGDGSDHANVATATTNIANLTNGTTVRTGRVKNSTTGSVGTVPTGVTAIHYGNGSHITTVLTLTNVDLGAVVAAANEAHGALIYTFPAGVHVHEVTYMNIGVVGAAGVKADTPDLGIGSVIATGAVAVLGGTPAFEDYVTGQTMTDVDGTATVAMTGATAGVLSDISLNLATSVKAVFLNIADGWAAPSATLLASGTIVLKWNKIA